MPASRVVLGGREGRTIALLWGGSHVRVPAIAALVTWAAIVLSHLGGIEGGLALREELANDERFGIWGGLSERERRRFKRKLAS